MNKKFTALFAITLMATSGAWGMATLSKFASKLTNLFEPQPATSPAASNSSDKIKNYPAQTQYGATCGFFSAYHSVTILEELLKNPKVSLEDNEAISKRIFDIAFKTKTIPQLQEHIITARKQNALQQHILKWINTNFVFKLSDSTIEAESKEGTAKPMMTGGFTDFATFMAQVAVSKSGKTSISKQNLTIWLAEYFKQKKAAQNKNPDNNNVPEQFTLINKLNEYIQASLENDPSLHIDEQQIHDIAQKYYTTDRGWSSYTTEYTDNAEVETLTKTITQLNSDIISDYITVIGDTNELPFYIPDIANNWHNKKYPCHFFILGSMEQPTEGELKEHLTQLGEGHWITVCTHEQHGRLQTHVLDSMNHDQSNNPRVQEIVDQLSTEVRMPLHVVDSQNNNQSNNPRIQDIANQLSNEVRIPQIDSQKQHPNAWNNLSTGIYSQMRFNNCFTSNMSYTSLLKPSSTFSYSEEQLKVYAEKQLKELNSLGIKGPLDELD